MERIDVGGEGFLFGYGIFETIKIENKKAKNIELHFERLKNSARELDINCDISFKYFETIIEKEIESFKEKDYILRFSLVKDGNSSKYFINSRKNNYSSEKYEKGFKIKISDIKKNSSSKLLYHKTLNYMENYMELMKAKNLGYDEVIFFNEKGYLCEGAISNIFVVIGDRIYTPRLDNGLLPGIKRFEIIRKLKEVGENIIEDNITYEMLFSATAIFVTNSILEIMKVTEIDGRKFLSNEVSILKDKILK